MLMTFYPKWVNFIQRPNVDIKSYWWRMILIPVVSCSIDPVESLFWSTKKTCHSCYSSLVFHMFKDNMITYFKICWKVYRINKKALPCSTGNVSSTLGYCQLQNQVWSQTGKCQGTLSAFLCTNKTLPVLKQRSNCDILRCSDIRNSFGTVSTSWSFIVKAKKQHIFPYAKVPEGSIENITIF